MADNDDIRKVLELIEEFPICMLTSLDADGGLESRPMARQKAEFDGAFYFLTERGNALTAQVEADPHVNLAFAKMGSWVSVQGTASVAHDEAKLKQLWDSSCDAWLKGGPENPDNVVLSVEPNAAQYWDSPGAPIMVASMIKAKLTGGEPEAGKSGTAEF